MGFQQKLKKELNKKGITVRSIANSIDMSEANLYKCFKRDSIETKHLEKISKVIQVPVSYFFDNDSSINLEIGDNSANGNNNTIGSNLAYDKEIGRLQLEITKLKSENQGFKEKNKLLEKLIKDKEEIINLLKSK